MQIEKIQSIFAEEGFRSEIDRDGDLQFKYEGKTYFFEVSTDDPMFIRIVFPAFWPIESEHERQLADQTALKVCTAIKVAKVFRLKDDMYSSAELFLPNEEAVRPIINRALSVVSGAAQMFASEMRS